MYSRTCCPISKTYAPIIPTLRHQKKKRLLGKLLHGSYRPSSTILFASDNPCEENGPPRAILFMGTTMGPVYRRYMGE